MADDMMHWCGPDGDPLCGFPYDEEEGSISIVTRWRERYEEEDRFCSDCAAILGLEPFRWWPIKTWIGALNFFVLQWACFRLAQRIDIETGKRIGWMWMGPVLPLSGWWNDYVWLKTWIRNKWLTMRK